MKLSEYLQKWRCDRPDEWTMDNFIRHAEALEAVIDKVRRSIELPSCNDYTAYIDHLDRIEGNQEPTEDIEPDIVWDGERWVFAKDFKEGDVVRVPMHRRHEIKDNQ